MFLKAKLLEFEAKKPIVILNKDDAEELDVKPLDRVELTFKRKKTIAIVNIAEKFIKPGEIGLYGLVKDKLNPKDAEKINVIASLPPNSLTYIKKKINGYVLNDSEIKHIINDIVKNRLSEIEITSFVTSLHNHKMTMEENASLSKAMTISGKRLDLGKRKIFDKHSIGGVPGDKTSILVVPIVAAAGLTIPKTSSRAITSPAGTADRFECLTNVNLSLEEIKKVVQKTNACLVWGGSVDLAPADDVFVKIEYPLSIDPLLLPSVMSKKMAVNADYVVIDIPTGRGTKVKTIGEANNLANQFLELGKKLNIKVACVSTFGEQPIGYALGPALEAKEALETIMNGNGTNDLIDKAINIASVLLNFGGVKNPVATATYLLKSGKAYKKLKEIISAQGGDPKIGPDDICLGSETIKVKSNKNGKIWWISNHSLVQIAREAGTPKNKGAGILLHKKLGDTVKKGDVLFEIYAEKKYKLNRAIKIANKLDVIGIGEKYDMVLAKVPAEKHAKHFILER